MSSERLTHPLAQGLSRPDAGWGRSEAIVCCGSGAWPSWDPSGEPGELISSPQVAGDPDLDSVSPEPEHHRAFFNLDPAGAGPLGPARAAQVGTRGGPCSSPLPILAQTFTPSSPGGPRSPERPLPPQLCEPEPPCPLAAHPAQRGLPPHRSVPAGGTPDVLAGNKVRTRQRAEIKDRDPPPHGTSTGWNVKGGESRSGRVGAGGAVTGWESPQG